MDDYHEFKFAHKIEIKEWQLYLAPNYVSITIMIMIPSGMLTIPSINLIIESDAINGDGAIRSRNINGGGTIKNLRIVKIENVNGGRTIRSGGATRNNGSDPSTNTEGSFMMFSLIVKCWRVVKELLAGLDKKTIKFVKVSTIRRMRIYERHMHG